MHGHFGHLGSSHVGHIIGQQTLLNWNRGQLSCPERMLAEGMGQEWDCEMYADNEMRARQCMNSMFLFAREFAGAPCHMQERFALGYIGIVCKA